MPCTTKDGLTFGVVSAQAGTQDGTQEFILHGGLFSTPAAAIQWLNNAELFGPDAEPLIAELDIYTGGPAAPTGWYMSTGFMRPAVYKNDLGWALSEADTKTDIVFVNPGA